MRIKLSDGTYATLPDNMSDAEVEEALRALPAPTGKEAGISVRFPGQEKPLFDPAQYGEDWRAAKKAISALPKAEQQAARQSYYDMVSGKEREATRSTTLGRVGQFANDLGRQYARNLPIFGEWLDEARADLRSTNREEYEHELAKDQAVRRIIDKEDEETRAKINAIKAQNPFLQNSYVPDLAKLTGMDTPGGIAKGAGVGTSLALPAARPIESLRKARPIVESAIRGGVTAGTTGAAEAAGAANEDKLGEGAKGAVAGTLLGTGLGVIGGKLYKNATTKTLGANVPKRVRGAETQYERARRLAAKNYKVVDDAGISLNNVDRLYANGNGTFMEDLQQSIRSALQKEMNYSPAHAQRLLPGIPEILDDVQRMTSGSTLSLQDLDNLRRTVGAYARSADPKTSGTRSAAALISEIIDDKIDDAIKMAAKNPKVLAGISGQKTPKAVLTALKNARKHTRNAKVAKVLKDAIESSELDATTGGTTFTKAFETKVRQLLKNDRTKKLFTKPQKDMLLKAVKGGTKKQILRFLTPFDSSLGRFFSAGPLVYGSDPASMAISAGLGGSAKLASRASDKITRRAGERALDVIAAGSTRPGLTRAQQAVQPYLPQGDLVRQALAIKLGQSAGYESEADREKRLLEEQLYRRTFGLKE